MGEGTNSMTPHAVAESKLEMQRADTVIHVQDATSAFRESERAKIEEITSGCKKLVVVFNKWNVVKESSGIHKGEVAELRDSLEKDCKALYGPNVDVFFVDALEAETARLQGLQPQDPGFGELEEFLNKELRDTESLLKQKRL